MKFRTAFQKILKNKKVSYRKLAEAVNAAYAEIGEDKTVSGPAVGSMVKKGNPSFDAARPYLDALGYDVVLVPKGSAALLPEGSYVLDGRDD